MLVEIAIGDSYGFPFEFKNEDFVKNNNYLKYHTSDGKGVYSDDTQMSLAIVEHMLESAKYSRYKLDKGDFNDKEIADSMRGYITHLNYAQNFSSVYNRDIRNGYSKRVKSLVKLKIAKNLVHAAACLEPRNSNGCVMRSVPLGLYPNVSLVKQAALINTSLTHASIECIEASTFIALIAHWYYHDYTKEVSLLQFLYNEMEETTVERIVFAYTGGPIPCDAEITASFCLKAVTSNKNMEDLLKYCIEPTGDVDSVAAVSMGLASIIPDFRNNLPAFMYEDMENYAFGIDYLRVKDKELFKLFPRK